MTRAVLSIGSNQGDRLAHLQVALDVFAPWLTAVSPVVQTPPWGPVAQPDFFNAVLLARDPAADARHWLDRAHAAEDRAGRTREVRWGPRTLDVDVVTVSDGDGPAQGGTELHSDDPVLTLPHPFAAQRAFVLVPWLAVDPDARLGGRSVGELLAALPPADRDAVSPRADLAWSRP